MMVSHSLSVNHFISVVIAAPRQCIEQHYLSTPSPSGFLWSGATDVTCPWRLQVSPGQQINLTLYDFSLNSHSSGTGSIGPLCRKYAVVCSSKGLIMYYFFFHSDKFEKNIKCLKTYHPIGTMMYTKVANFTMFKNI